MASETTIQRLRQNAVTLIAKDQSVKTLADIIAEMCLITERQQREIDSLRAQLDRVSPGSNDG